MDHGIGDEFAGEDHGVVDDVRETPPWRVSRTNERAPATERPSGSKLAAARAVITELPIWCLVASPSPVPVSRRFDSLSQARRSVSVPGTRGPSSDKGDQDVVGERTSVGFPTEG